MLVAIYARYSSDKQSETSIADQLRLCHAKIKHDGWHFLNSYHDEGISGSIPVSKRIGGAKMLIDALESKFDGLIMESLDRLSRDLVEQETIVRRLEHRGIRILGLSDGYDSHQKGRQLVRGMRGLINEMYLEDLKAKTHRGMSGQVSRGFAAGGAAFGYKNFKVEGGSLIQIDEEAAQWVKWIFEKFVKGWSIKRIVVELNRLDIPSPRGKAWGVSGIYGSPRKGSGILNNELYIGRYVWNRSRWVKDPDTCKRMRIENPDCEWLIEDRPELRILPQSLWEGARERMNKQRAKSGMKGRGGKTRTLLSGLLKCGHCGGTITAVNSHSYGCSTHKYQGPHKCHGVSISKKIAEKAVISELTKFMLSHETAEYVYQATKRQLDETFKNQSLEEQQLREKITELETQIERYIDAIGAIGISESISRKLRDAEEMKTHYLTLLKTSSEKVSLPELPEIERRCNELISNLQNVKGGDIDKARHCISEMIEHVKLYREKQQIFAEIETSQTAFLGAAGLSLRLVAGAGFEPTTFGL